jgi:valyl-tRNA synthetase
VQAFEIIRTWLFYTVVQSHLHFDRVPWMSVMISGWGLNEQGRKISKRDLDQSTTVDGFNRYVPDDVIDRYGADALRLWATKARIGNDLRYTEKDVRTGRKFGVKLWNVARFVSLYASSLPAFVELSRRTPVDRWLLSHLADAVDEVTAAFDASDFTLAYQAASKCFWSVYCDRYIEMVKDRFLQPDEHTQSDRDSAQWTLWESLRVMLGLFAPFTPFLTEHLYQRFYASGEGADSLHLTPWPVADPAWRTDRSAIDDMATVLDAVRALRSRFNLGNGTRVARLVLDARTARAQTLTALIAEPLRVAARADQVVFAPAESESGVPDLTVALVLGGFH